MKEVNLGFQQRKTKERYTLLKLSFKDVQKGDEDSYSYLQSAHLQLREWRKQLSRHKCYQNDNQNPLYIKITRKLSYWRNLYRSD